MDLSAETCLNVISSLIASELSSQRGSSFERSERVGWSLDDELSAEGIEVDSLELVAVATAVSSFFNLHETGVEDRLLIDRRLGAWVDVVRDSMPETKGVTFRTSGTTGTPKAVEHDRSLLMSDASWFAGEVEGIRRVVSLIPRHHLYGFIHAVLVPDVLGVAVMDKEFGMRSSVMRSLEPGDLVVATPTVWAELVRCGLRFPEGVRGTTSGSAMPESVWRSLLDLGLESLVDVFGSTETSALGVRDHYEERYRPRSEARVREHESDRLEIGDDGLFVAGGRTDGVVQVGGVNVSPRLVEDALCEHPGVQACAVRVRGDGASARFLAFVVPRGGAKNEVDLQQDLKVHMAGSLPSVARPASYTFGDRLPMSPLGKVMAWTEQV